MSENEAPLPASPLPGRPDDAALASLPEKLRVHALARLVGSSSREVLAVLARLDVAGRSAQSSVDRDTVSQVSRRSSRGGHRASTAGPAEPHAGPGTPEPVAEPVGRRTEPAQVTGAIGGAPAAPAALFLAPDIATPEAEAPAPAVVGGAAGPPGS